MCTFLLDLVIDCCRFEILDHVPDYRDVDDGSSHLEEVRKSVSDNIAEYRPAQLDGRVPPRLTDLNVHSEGHLLPLDSSLTCMYDYLIENWLRQLHSKIPGRTRIARERTLRRVAMILCLARAGVNLGATGNFAKGSKTDHTDSVSRQLDLPVRQREPSPSGNKSIEGALSSPPHSSQLSVDASFLDPNRREVNEQDTHPSFSAAGVTPTSHSTTSVTTSNDNNEDPACVRLRQYTTVNFQSRLPPRMSRILSHWTQESDPAHYDWSIATASATAPSDVEGAADKAQRKSGVRRERLSKNWQIDLVKSASQPHRLWGSQPQLLQPVPSSSQIDEESAPMSQVERGLYGGRQGPLKKQGAKPRKARMAGF